MVNEIPDELYGVLGRITAHFSELETSLLITISLLVSDDMRVVSRLVGGDSFEVLLTKLTDMFILKIPDKLLLEKFDKLKRQMEDINTKRNRYLHSNWILDNNNEIMRVKFKRKIRYDINTTDAENVNVQDLKDFVQDITKAQREIGNLIGKIKGLKKAGKLNE